MKNISIIPQRLKIGDKIGVVSLSGDLKPEFKDGFFANAVVEVQNKLGLEIVIGENVWVKDNYRAGTVDQRISDLHKFIADPDIKAIICSRGGKQVNDLLEHVDFELIKNNPKIYAGMSDAGVFLNAITAKTGLVTYYGVEFVTGWGAGLSDWEVENIKKMWFEEDTEYGVIRNPNWEILDEVDVNEVYTKWRVLKEGKASGRLVGGNFRVNMYQARTEYYPDLEGSILVLESWGWKDWDIHCALQALRTQGVFKKINGIILGYQYNHLLIDSSRNRDFKSIVEEVTDGYVFPVVYVPDIGHSVRNMLTPIGQSIEINTDNKEFLKILNDRL